MAEKKKSVVLSSEETVKTTTFQRIKEALAGPFRMIPIVCALILIWIVFQTMKDTFLGPQNLTNLFVQIVNIALASMSLFLLLLIGEIDLSVSATGAVCATVVASINVTYGYPLPLAIVVGLVVGVLINMCKGWVTTNFGAPAFIVTCGFKLALSGIILLLLPQTTMQIPLVGRTISLLATSYLPLHITAPIFAIAVIVVLLMNLQNYREKVKYGRPANIFKDIFVKPLVLTVLLTAFEIAMTMNKGVNYAVMLLLVCLAVFNFICQETTFGAHLYAIGGNAEAVRRAGINVKRTKTIIFMLSGLLAALAGIVQAARIQGVSATSIDENLQMNAIAAAVLGGASLSGGRGDVWGILLGALVIGSITNGMYLIGASTAIRYIMQGVILVLAILLDAVVTGKKTTK